MAVGITALGAYVPPTRVTNDDLSLTLDTSDEWIQSRTGIRERFIALPEQNTSHLAILAVENLIQTHGKAAIAGVDLVIVATATPDAFFPSVAALVQGHFGLKAAAFDLSAACAGWVYALNAATAQIQAGLAQKALVIGAETLSKITNWQDRNTAVLFSDGAGAAIIEHVAPEYGFRHHIQGADGTGGKWLHVGSFAKTLPDGTDVHPYMVQNGREVFKFAVRTLPHMVKTLTQKAGLSLADVAWIVPHQANLRIIDAASTALGVGKERFVVTVDRYANNSAATVPMALHHAHQQGLFKAGDAVVLAGFGGGLSWAAALMYWGVLHTPSHQPTQGEQLCL